MKRFPAFLTTLAVSLALVLSGSVVIYAKEQQDFNSLLKFWQNPENKKPAENTAAPVSEPANPAAPSEVAAPVAPEVPSVPETAAAASEIKTAETEAAKAAANPTELEPAQPPALEVPSVTPEMEAAVEPGAPENAVVTSPEAPAQSPVPETKPAEAATQAPDAKPEGAASAPAAEEKVEAVKVIPQQKKSSDAIVLIDDFNSGVRSNLLGGAMGPWMKDEYDDTQGCDIDFVERPRLGKSGYSMQISYDVDSPKQAYNGVWIKLEDFDARPYKFLVMYFKAPNYPPYGTDNLKLELKNQKGESGAFRVTKIPRGAWREYKIPLKKFKGLKDLSALTELIIVFEDKTTNPKEGIVFLDQIYFTQGEIRRPD